MRLAISQQVSSSFSPALAVAREGEVPGPASYAATQVFLACQRTKWMCEHGSTGIQVLHSTESAYSTRNDVHRASVDAQRTRTSVGTP
jgi:hypothetical protein